MTRPRSGLGPAGRFPKPAPEADTGRAEWWANTRSGGWAPWRTHDGVTFAEAKARRRPSQVLVWRGSAGRRDPVYVASGTAILDRFMVGAVRRGAAGPVGPSNRTKDFSRVSAIATENIT